MAKEKSEDKAIRTVTLANPYHGFAETAFALGFESKNIYNTCIFLIKQVLTAYQFDQETKIHSLKSDLHVHQLMAIQEYNSVIDAVNAERKAKAERASKQLNLIGRLESSMQNLFSSILDVTVLDNVAKIHYDQYGQIAYRKLPASVSQQTVRSVIDAWTGYFAAVKAYFKSNGESFTGQPRYPDYLPKSGTYPVEIPYASLSNATGGFPKPRVLTDIDKASAEELEIFYSLNFKQLIKAACDKRGFDDYKVQHIRIVGKTIKEMKIEVVVNLKQVFPEGSLLKQIYAEHGDVLRGMTYKERMRFILDVVTKKDEASIAGLDFGVRNLVTCAFSTGNRGIVHSGARYINKIEHFDKLLDGFVSENTPERLKELDDTFNRRDADDKRIPLSPAEKRERRVLRAQIYTHPEYLRIKKNKANWKNDYLHKLSYAVVEKCVELGIQVIVFGRNKGWKQEVDMKTKENRNFYAAAHTELQNLIRYKAEKHGIVVLETEESYTSKTSFVDNDDLLEYTEDEDKKAADKASVTYSGYRSSKNRNWFVRRKDMLEKIGIHRIHADLNGAFNIIRKVFSYFRYHDGLSVKFNVNWISPRLGATTVHALC